MMPVTFRLWHLLSLPSKGHPLHRRLVASRGTSGWQRLTREVLAPVAPVLYLGIIMFGCCAATSPSSGPLVMAGALGVALFHSTFYGLGWSAGIAAQLAGERERGSFELLCLLPGGGLGVAWATASGVLHRDNAFFYRYRRQLLILRLVALAAVALAFGTLLDRHSVPGSDAILILITATGLILASWLDYIQSIVLATLSGIIAGTHSGSRFDAETFAWMLFLALQMILYTAVLLIGFVLLPRLAATLPLSGTVRELGLVVLRVAVLYVLRERVIVIFWHLAAVRLNISTQQPDMLPGAVA